jgi:hypothetical protein
MNGALTKTYRPSGAARAWVVVFVLPGALLIIWMGAALLSEAVFLAIATFVCAALLFTWLVFITTSRLTLNNEQLVRSWLGGTRVFAISQISRLEWRGGRGQLLLTVRAGKPWLMLSSLSFTKQELHEVASAILAFRGLEGQPLWPPYAQCIDIDEMSKRNAALHHAA